MYDLDGKENLIRVIEQWDRELPLSIGSWRADAGFNNYVMFREPTYGLLMYLYGQDICMRQIHALLL